MSPRKKALPPEADESNIWGVDPRPFVKDRQLRQSRVRGLLPYMKGPKKEEGRSRWCEHMRRRERNMMERRRMEANSETCLNEI